MNLVLHWSQSLQHHRLLFENYCQIIDCISNMDTIRRVAARECDRVTVHDLFVHEERSTYPSVWFNDPANEGLKPPLILPKFPKDTTIAQLRNTVYHGITHHTLDAHQAMLYIYFLLKENKMTLDSDWESFGRVIGVVNDGVSLDNLADVRVGTEEVTLSTLAVAAQRSDDKWMLLY